MSPEIDKKGDLVEKIIEGYKAEKYLVKTIFTMTKFKINLNEVKKIQKYENFAQY